MEVATEAVEIVGLATPMGWFEAETVGGAVRRAGFVATVPDAAVPAPTGLSPGASAVSAALVAYFGGEVDALDAVAVTPVGTEFRLRVWAALREIPAGTTCGYGELAARLGVPGAARAVGSANAANPVAVIVPCHRVVRGDGSIGGYAGGVERKRALLDHERRSKVSAVATVRAGPSPDGRRRAATSA